jgi:asparagine synthase (glutamine-hydrolysing)
VPGIVGLVTRKPRQQAEQELLRMVATMRHEDFYTTGTWMDEALGVYVGWTARGGAFDDGMPLISERKDIVLVFSGEEYSEAEDGGTAVETAASRGEAAYLLDVARRDDAFPYGLNGRFHGLLVDRVRGAVSLFNDRYGMHRVYYHEASDAFYFAAEAKAILALRPELRAFNLQSLGEFITCGCVLENRSLFKGIGVLPCAAKWSFENASLERKHVYFEPSEWEGQTALGTEAYYEELRDVFSRNLATYFRGRQTIGMSLTGGLDTRMIMAWHTPPPGSMPCYTFGGMRRDLQDVRVARQIAQVCRQSHQVIQVTSASVADFAQHAQNSVYLSDACVGVNLALDLPLYRQARSIASIRMTGNYGGELLRGVVAFKPVDPWPGLISPELSTYLNESKETYKRARMGHPVSFAVFRQAPWYHFGVAALEQTQVALRTPYLDNELVRTAFRAPHSTFTSNELCLRLIADGSRTLRDIPTDRGLGGRGGFRSAARRRLLDFQVRAEYAYDYGMPQWLAQIDHSLSPLHLENAFLWRHKLYQFRLWYKGVLAEYVRSILLASESLTRSYLQRKTVEHIVTGHLRGNRNHTVEIHTLLTLELAHRLFFSSDARIQNQ